MTPALITVQHYPHIKLRARRVRTAIGLGQPSEVEEDLDAHGYD